MSMTFYISVINIKTNFNLEERKDKAIKYIQQLMVLSASKKELLKSILWPYGNAGINNTIPFFICQYYHLLG